jgi:hypothetical protein
VRRSSVGEDEVSRAFDEAAMVIGVGHSARCFEKLDR